MGKRVQKIMLSLISADGPAAETPTIPGEDLNNHTFLAAE